MTSSFDALLHVQAHDTKLDQLRHQQEALPARADRDAARARLSALEASIAAEEATRADLARDQRRLDDEIETISTKRKHEEATLYGGTVNNARALQDLQEEIESLGRRITQLEDKDLELMEQIEPIDARLADLGRALEDQVRTLEAAEQQLTAAEAELVVAVDAERAARDAIVGSVDAALLAEYEKLRVGLGGIGVARLTGSSCGGCHLGLSAVEVSRIRRLGPGEITHCEECGRLLVP